MKIAKILSAAAAAAVGTSLLAVGASANFAPVSGAQPWIDTSSNQCYLVVVYSEGTDETDPVDFGIDISRIDNVTFTFTNAEPEYWDGQVGGWIGASTHNTDLYPAGSDMYNKYNWPVGGEFWGVIDEDLELDTQTEAAKPVTTVKVGDNTYSVTDKITNGAADPDFEDVKQLRVFLSEWGAIMSETVVTQVDFNDADGNLVLSLDGLGNVLYADTVDSGDAAPADTAPDTDTDTSAPAAATDSKGSPDTGVEGIAAVAGIAVVAAGAVVLSKKRK